MITTIYLIRHSVRFSSKLIDSYNTNQDKLIKNEKIILSVSGEKRGGISCGAPSAGRRVKYMQVTVLEHF